MTVYYLPSCKYKELHALSSQKIRTYLRAKPDHVIADCCKKSQSLFHDGDTVLTNCSSCAIITDEASPQANEMSIYEYLLGDEAFPWPDYHGEAITVQDCYRAAHKPAVQKAVRECLNRMNMRPVELEENHARTRFDGIYKYRRISDANLALAPKQYGRIQKEFIDVQPEDVQKAQMSEWVKQYRTDRVAVYCNSCLKGVQLGGADGVHLLDLITADLP